MIYKFVDIHGLQRVNLTDFGQYQCQQYVLSYLEMFLQLFRLLWNLADIYMYTDHQHVNFSAYPVKYFSLHQINDFVHCTFVHSWSPEDDAYWVWSCLELSSSNFMRITCVAFGKMSSPLIKSLPWNLVQYFMLPSGWPVITGDPDFFFLVQSLDANFNLSSALISDQMSAKQMTSPSASAVIHVQC